jgi:hypothetical protein
MCISIFELPILPNLKNGRTRFLVEYVMRILYHIVVITIVSMYYLPCCITFAIDCPPSDCLRPLIKLSVEVNTRFM